MIFRLLRLVPDKTNFDFFRLKFVAVGFSLLLAVASIISLSTQGLNFGIDFRGGILIEVRPHNAQTVDLGGLRGQLGDLGLGEIALQEFGAEHDILIRIQQQEGGETGQQRAVEKVRAALGAENYDFRRVEFVGPKVGEELKRAGIWAVILSLIGITIYIWFRFEFPFAVNALFITAHDVLTTLGLFSLLQLDFNLTSVAAILTLAGYSLNDTVVVFDRVRENMRKYRKMPFVELLNKSINDTLSRTISTSLATMLAVLAILFFAGPVVQGFALAMAWGILVGTYSSIYVGGPLLLLQIKEHNRAKYFNPEAKRDEAGFTAS